MQLQSVIAICLTLLFTACGASNFNRIFESSKQVDTIDQLIDNAEYAYDQGDFEKALNLAQEAHAIRPGERSAILMGYANLSLAGLDAFQITKRMIVAQENQPDSSESRTSNLFGLLAAAMNITESDFEAMSTGTFDGEPKVFKPQTASAARNSEVSSVNFFSKAIESLCPFVPKEAKQDSDPRHQECETSEKSNNLGSATFAWALSHLGEAITFYSLIFYTSANQTMPNIVARAKSLENFNSDPAAYLAKLTELTEIIESILPTDAEKSTDSLLNAIFSDLQSTNLALEASGAPKSVTKSVTKVITEIREKISDVSSITESNEAIKNKLTKSISNELKKQIEGLNTEQVNKDELCAAFEGINSDPANLPEACK